MNFLRPCPITKRVSIGANDSIDARTRYCAVYGHPIRHSASPAMQNAGIAALKLNWRYLAFDVHPDNLAEAIAGAKAMRFIGLNLTIPHKLLAVGMVDVVDPRAKTWGAVNTIVFETKNADGQWIPLAAAGEGPFDEVRSHGYNTDADAIVQSLKEDFSWPDLRGATVLLLGAGGAARSAALRLAGEGIDSLYIVNRTAENAHKLAAEIRKSHPKTNVAEGYPQSPVDLVLNATSLGLKSEDALPMDETWLKSRKSARVYDMIYNPKETALLRAARAAGYQACNGLGMLLYQGAEALRLWTGAKPPIDIMRAALEAHLHAPARRS